MVNPYSAFRKRILRPTPLLLCLLVCPLLTCGGCASGSGGSINGKHHVERHAPSMVLYNAPPTIDHFSFPETSHAQGEFVAWHADLDDAEGATANRIGHCNGTMMVTRRNDGHQDDREHRMTMIELDWEDSDDSDHLWLLPQTCLLHGCFSCIRCKLCCAYLLHPTMDLPLAMRSVQYSQHSEACSLG